MDYNLTDPCNEWMARWVPLLHTRARLREEYETTGRVDAEKWNSLVAEFRRADAPGSAFVTELWFKRVRRGGKI